MIVVTDLARTASFLMDVVGLDQREDDPERFSAEDGFEVHVCPVREFDPTINYNNWMPDSLPPFADSFAQRATHLSFRVESLVDVLGRVFAAGVQPFSLNAECMQTFIQSADEPLVAGSRSVYVHDPDGNLFEFVQEGVSLEVANLR